MNDAEVIANLEESRDRAIKMQYDRPTVQLREELVAFFISLIKKWGLNTVRKELLFLFEEMNIVV